jgi:transposase
MVSCRKRRDIIMNLKRRVFSKEFKLHVLSEVESGKPTVQVAREYQILPHIISRWRSQYETYADEAFAGTGKCYTQNARMSLLERKNAHLQAENDLLKKALSRLDETRSSASENGVSR